ncbi:MAG: ThuA domain-containing protein [Verrucomicrobiota bacterium]
MPLRHHRNRIAARWQRLGITAGLIAAVTWFAVFASAATPSVLVYQKNGKGYVHDNLAASAGAIRELGEQHGFGVEVSTNTAVFNPVTLLRFQAVIFANSNNEAFDTDEQRAAFQAFICKGGGFVGIHSSSASERDWTWFQAMQGGKFLRHAPIQKFTVRVLDLAHPATAHLDANWIRDDECYFFTRLNPDMQVLLVLDEASLRDPELPSSKAEKLKGRYPLAWYQQFEGSRQFYTALGHRIEHYSDPAFRQHLLGGIRWALGLAQSPTSQSGLDRPTVHSK